MAEFKKNIQQHPGRFIGVIEEPDTSIPIVWTDFMMSTSYRYPGQAVLGGVGMLSSNVGQYYYAVKVIPGGYTATGALIYGVDPDENSEIKCYSATIAGGIPSLLASAVNFDAAASPDTATVDFGANDVVGDGKNTVIVEWNPNDASPDETLYGGLIIIAKT